MTEKNTTLNKDINLIERDCGYWDYEFQYGDLVISEDKQSLRNGLIIACLTSWNYLNRQGNPTYSVFGNKSYWELKKKKSSMREYTIKQYFIEVLNRIRRVHRVVDLQVIDHPTDPNAYRVYFTVEAVNDEIVNGEFNIGTNKDLPSSYMEVTLSSDYATNENPLQINVSLKSEYGTGLSDELIYMYIKKDNEEEYQFYKAYGSTDKNGQLTITYTPKDSIEKNSIYFIFTGNNEYQSCSSEPVSFKSEIYTYQLQFAENNINTHSQTSTLSLNLQGKLSTEEDYKPISRALIKVTGSDHKQYNAITNEDGNGNVTVTYSNDTTYTASYKNQKAQAEISIISETPSLTYECKDSLYYKEPFILNVSLTDSIEQDIPNQRIEVYVDDELIDTLTFEDKTASLNKTITSLTLGEHTLSLKLLESKFYNETTTEPYTFTVEERTLNINFTSNYTDMYCDETLILETNVTDNLYESVRNLPVTLYEHVLPTVYFNDTCQSDNTSQYTDTVKVDGGNQTITLTYVEDYGYQMTGTGGEKFCGFVIPNTQGLDNIKISCKVLMVGTNRYTQTMIGLINSLDGNSYDMFRIRSDKQVDYIQNSGDEIWSRTNVTTFNNNWVTMEVIYSDGSLDCSVYNAQGNSLINYTHSTNDYDNPYFFIGRNMRYGAITQYTNYPQYIKDIKVESIIDTENESVEKETLATDKEGNASFQLYNIAEGSYGYYVNVGELENYNTNIEPVPLDYTVNVHKHTPTVELTISESLLIVDNTYDLTATVTSNGTPLKNIGVMFYEEDTLIDDIILTDANGEATIPLTFYTDEEHTIKAVTVEDNLYKPSTIIATYTVQDHDYSADIEVTFNDFDYKKQELSFIVHYIMKDYNESLGYTHIGNMVLACEDTGDEWWMTDYNPNNSFEGSYILSEEDSIDSFTFTFELDNELLLTKTVPLPVIPKRYTNITVTQATSGNHKYLTGNLNDGIANEGLDDKTLDIYHTPNAIDWINSCITLSDGDGTISSTGNRIYLYAQPSASTFAFNCDTLSFASEVQFIMLNRSTANINVDNTDLDDWDYAQITLTKTSENKKLSIADYMHNTVLFEKTVGINETLGNFLVEMPQYDRVTLQGFDYSEDPKIFTETVTTDSNGEWESNGITNNTTGVTYKMLIEFKGDKFYNSSNATINWQW